MADTFSSLDQLKDAVTASAGGVQGSTADEQRSYQPLAAPREPQRDDLGVARRIGVPFPDVEAAPEDRPPGIDDDRADGHVLGRGAPVDRDRDAPASTAARSTMC